MAVPKGLKGHICHTSPSGRPLSSSFPAAPTSLLLLGRYRLTFLLFGRVVLVLFLCRLFLH
jgi:hypothetical protein